MAEPYRGILGPVLGQVEAIKSARSNRAMDELQAKYLGERIGLQQQEQTQATETARLQAAREVAVNRMRAVRQHPNPVQVAPQFFGDPQFQAAMTVLGADGKAFLDTNMSNEEAIANLDANITALGGQTQQEAIPVQSTFVGKNGNQWVTMRDGSVRDTGVPVSQFAMRPVETAQGLQAFQPASGQMGPVISSAQDITTMRAERAGTIAGAQAEAKAEVIPAEARTDARNKMVRARAASRRLNRVSGAVEALADNMVLQGGPFQGQAISVTKEGQELDNAVAQLLPEITALTRVPGVGSQSDLEQRLANLALPSSSFHPDVNRRNIEELNAFLADLENALGNVAAGVQPGRADMPSGGEEAAFDPTKLTDEELRELAR